MKRQKRAATVVLVVLAGALDLWACDGGTQLAGDGCEPGTVACNGSTAVRCNPSGDGWLTIVECPSPLVCRVGVCVDPSPPRCGDGTCDSSETCLVCADDCGCGGDDVCVGGACVPRASLVCGDGLCTADETCASCVEDCACAAGTACRDEVCVPDGSCGDATCAATEDCLACPADCGCGAELLCRDRACVPVPPPVRVSAVRSGASSLESAWLYLNREWRRFGDVPVVFEVTLLYFEGIDHEALTATGADVLVIYGDGSDLTDDELAAILWYLQDDHGLIVTGSTSLWDAPGLAELVGVEPVEPFYYGVGGNWPIVVRALVADHPLLHGLPDGFEVEPSVSLAPWRPAAGRAARAVAIFEDCEITDGVYSSGGIVAKESDEGSSGRAVFFSFHPALAGPDGVGGDRATETDLRLLYNALLWAAGRTD